MAAAADDEDNELNFSDIDSDNDTDVPSTRPTSGMIAHKNMNTVIAHKEMKASGIQDDEDSEESPENDFEPISPVNNNDENSDEGQSFEPISPDDENNEENEAEVLPTNNFENISDDEEEVSNNIEEQPEEQQEISDNELNFDNDSDKEDIDSENISNEVVPNATPDSEKEPSVNSVENTEDTGTRSPGTPTQDEIVTVKPVIDIEAPVPSPFSDIGDVDDIPGTEGIISDILKGSQTKESDFDIGTSNNDESKDIENVPELDLEQKTDVSKDEESSVTQEQPKSNVSSDEEGEVETGKHGQSSEKVENENPDSPDPAEEAIDDNLEKEETAAAKNEDKNEEKKEENEEDSQEDAGDLIADIFGDSDEEEEAFEGFTEEELPPVRDEELEEEMVSHKKKDHHEKKDESEDEDEIPVRDFVSDFDIMLQKRKEMNRMKRKSKKDYDICGDNDEHIAAMIRQMKEAAEEDRMLNQCGKAATKKLKMLPTVISHLRKADLQAIFIDCGVLPAMKEWLTPLPDHALPHINIRKVFLKMLLEFPPLDKGALKVSGIGRAVMLLFKHPKEIAENKRMAGKIISNWARPIFNVTTNFHEMSREERESRDKVNIPESKRRRLSSDTETKKHQRLDDDDDANIPRKPGDKGWIGRARVPMPSHRDYVNRPVSKIENYEYRKGTSSSGYGGEHFGLDEDDERPSPECIVKKMKTRRSTRLQTLQKSKGIKLLVPGDAEDDPDVALKETDSINVCLEKGSPKKKRANQADPTSDASNKNEAKTSVEKSKEKEMESSSGNNLEISSPKKNREKDSKASPNKIKENELKSSPKKNAVEDLELGPKKRNEKKEKLKTEKNCEKELDSGKISVQMGVNNQGNFEENAVCRENIDKCHLIDSETTRDFLGNIEKAPSNENCHSVKPPQKESPQKNLPAKEHFGMSATPMEGNHSKNGQKEKTIESQGLNELQPNQSTSQNETFLGDEREIENSECGDYSISNGRYSAKVAPTNEIDNNGNSSSNSESDDDCPIDMSLHESKLKILEQNQRQKESVTAQQQRKRKLKTERDEANKLRKEKIKRHKIFIPDKLDDEILRKVELNKDENGDNTQKTIKKKLVIPSPKKEVKNNKIIFSEEVDITDEGFCDADQKKSTVFQAKHIQNVQKSCKVNSAQEFLRNHFYGNRLDRIQLHSKFNEKRRTINAADNNMARKRKKKYKI